MEATSDLASIDVAAAARRVDGVVRRTALVPFELEEAEGRIELRLKLECEQVTGAFKARGAWNQVSQLVAEGCGGVVATSSGNHARALAWAARRAGIPARVHMPAASYPNKIEACREEGAEVVLAADRAEAEERAAADVASGWTLVHPYDAPRTIEGAGTVGLEILEDWPELELCFVPVGGGGLVSGCALAFARASEPGKGRGRVAVHGIEPAGSPNLGRSLAAGHPVPIDPITTRVQGLCPIVTGRWNLAVVSRHVERMWTVEDDEIFAAQRRLVASGLVVEPAGAASLAGLARAVAGRFLAGLEGRSAADPLRVVCVVSGGNPDPEQLAAIRAAEGGA